MRDVLVYLLIVYLKTAPDGPNTLMTAFTRTFKPLERLAFSGTFNFKPGNRKRSGETMSGEYVGLLSTVTSFSFI
jgi:hypothetical protein